MYNFNIGSAISTSPLVGIDLMGSNTPRTPEILNSLIAMTNPFEYSSATSQMTSLSDSNNLRPSEQDENKYQNFRYDLNSQSNTSSSSSSELESPTNNVSFQLASLNQATPSIQQTRSQLIKAGVKLLIQNKRKNSASSCETEHPEKVRVISPSSDISRHLNMIEDVPSYKKRPKLSSSKSISSCDESVSERKYPRDKFDLTPDDEDRRRRRRERNKIAATKCRLKKRECINNLIKESESLETQNVDLKGQLKDLKEQYQYLTDMWQSHQLECSRKKDLVSKVSSPDNSNQLIENRQAKSKDNNNNKHAMNSMPTQLPSFSPLINCNLSFDFY